MLGRRALGRAALLASLLAGPRTARAQKAADTLRVTWRDAVPDLDPYRNQLRAGFVLAHHVWDCLVDRDPETFQIRPLPRPVMAAGERDRAGVHAAPRRGVP